MEENTNIIEDKTINLSKLSEYPNIFELDDDSKEYYIKGGGKKFVGCEFVSDDYGIIFGLHINECEFDECFFDDIFLSFRHITGNLFKQCEFDNCLFTNCYDNENNTLCVNDFLYCEFRDFTMEADEDRGFSVYDFKPINWSSFISSFFNCTNLVTLAMPRLYHVPMYLAGARFKKKNSTEKEDLKEIVTMEVEPLWENKSSMLVSTEFEATSFKVKDVLYKKSSDREKYDGGGDDKLYAVTKNGFIPIGSWDDVYNCESGDYVLLTLDKVNYAISFKIKNEK